MTSEPGPSTRAVGAGLPAGEPGAPFLPGPQFAAPFHLPGDPADSPYVYGRHGQPGWDAYERAVGELEGGQALVFASGMAAVTAALHELAGRGPIVLPADGYFTVRQVAEDLEARGVDVRLVPTATEDYVRGVEGASLVWVETPSNPGLDVCDVARVADAARGAGARLVVDNTLATPLLQRPLELGADVSMVSATKALSGHSDLLLGYLATRDETLVEALSNRRRRTGAIAGPFDTWLAHRSLATAGVRIERQGRNAQAIAECLAGRGDVDGVRYPGLSGDPAHEAAARQMRGFGPVVGFDLGSAGRAQAFLGAAELLIEATSFGGLHTSAERRARWGGDAVGEGFIRLSAGIEDTGDLLADLEQALRRAS